VHHGGGVTTGSVVVDTIHSWGTTIDIATKLGLKHIKELEFRSIATSESSSACEELASFASSEACPG